MSYKIIKHLTDAGELNLLDQLSAGVEKSRKDNDKKHDVWELSFDWKECRSDEFSNQKLNYMHSNPCHCWYVSVASLTTE